MSNGYVGAPWRSRFIRAPKVALEITQREGFAPLEDFARIRLGLKTGSDKFFFVVRAEATPRSKSARSGAVRVRGLGGSWEGELLRRDLLPAILNPHQLIERDKRVFTVARDVDIFYLHPKSSVVTADLNDYVRQAEREGVNRLRLVHSNAGEKRWYLQTRPLVRSPWVLPYNSAYDYGAFDNAVGAVLNGRFVGVDPLPGVDSDLLGAALNSTFFIVGRLLEGTTTGVEGAFDAGPPAVRRMLIPDVSKMKKTSTVLRVLEQLRDLNIMPPAPARDLQVHPLRVRLDVALLTALGYSKGEASALTGRVYESYARWRSSVEDVEAAMQVNRRSMARSGRTRAARRDELAAQRIWAELEHSVPLIPTGLLTQDDELVVVEAPRKIKVPEQEPLFQPGVVVSRDGQEMDLGSYNAVRYAAMLEHLGFEPPYHIPAESERAREIVEAFDRAVGAVREAAREKAAAYVGDPALTESVIRLVERQWHHRSRQAGMTPYVTIPT